MKSTATITFHASHNYGSNLQAYALQQVLLSLGYKNQIINLRTERQKDLYAVFTKRRGLKYIVKNLSHLFYYFPLKRAYNKFEDFINNNLILTKEYNSEEELRNANLQFDAFISGSDQIWNPVPVDFDWSYYLTFVKRGRIISYAASFGQLASTGEEAIEKKIASCLSSYNSISVREEGAANNVIRLIGKTPTISCDPTLLLAKEKWLDLIKNEKRIVKGDYIFFYTLFADPERMNIIKRVAKATGMPVVTSHFSNQYDVFNPFIKRYDAGPLEFLTLIRDAKLVVVSSFHGAVFSTLLNVPFYAIDGMKDARISTLLKTAGLEDREITVDNVEDKCELAYDIDFDKVNNRIEKARKPSIDYLRDSLSL